MLIRERGASSPPSARALKRNSRDPRVRFSLSPPFFLCDTKSVLFGLHSPIRGTAEFFPILIKPSNRRLCRSRRMLNSKIRPMPNPHCLFPPEAAQTIGATWIFVESMSTTPGLTSLGDLSFFSPPCAEGDRALQPYVSIPPCSASIADINPPFSPSPSPLSESIKATYIRNNRGNC